MRVLRVLCAFYVCAFLSMVRQGAKCSACRTPYTETHILQCPPHRPPLIQTEHLAEARERRRAVAVRAADVDVDLVVRRRRQQAHLVKEAAVRLELADGLRDPVRAVGRRELDELAWGRAGFERAPISGRVGAWCSKRAGSAAVVGIERQQKQAGSRRPVGHVATPVSQRSLGWNVRRWPRRLARSPASRSA